MAINNLPTGSTGHSSWLIAKFALVQVIGIVGLFFAWQVGLVEQIYTIDTIHFTTAIFVFFIIMNTLTGWHVVRNGIELDRINRTGRSPRLDTYRAALSATTSPETVRNAFESRMALRIKYLQLAVLTLARIGMFGVVLGVMFAFLMAANALTQSSGGVSEHMSVLFAPTFREIAIAIAATVVALPLGEWLEIGRAHV